MIHEWRGGLLVADKTGYRPILFPANVFRRMREYPEPSRGLDARIEAMQPPRTDIITSSIPMSDIITQNSSEDQIDLRGFLKCTAWAVRLTTVSSVETSHSLAIVDSTLADNHRKL
jgi:hypothetical protein